MDDRESRKYQWLEDNSGDPIDDNSSKSRKAPAVSPSDSRCVSQFTLCHCVCRSLPPTKHRKHPLPPEKYFGCSYKNCRASGYASNDDLVRHKKIVHGEITYGKSFVCHHSPCTKKKDIGFWPRADLFCDHLLRVHNLKLKAEDAIREYANQNVEIGGSANFSGPSHVPDAQENRPDRYSSDFAAHLLNRLSQQPLDAETAQRVVHRLPNLLKCYALKPIDYVSSSQNDILFHVYRNRRSVHIRHIYRIDIDITLLGALLVDLVSSTNSPCWSPWYQTKKTR